MEITVDPKAKKIINSLSEVDQGHISGYIDLLSKNGFSMTGKYLKKLENNL